MARGLHGLDHWQGGAKRVSRGFLRCPASYPAASQQLGEILALGTFGGSWDGHGKWEEKVCSPVNPWVPQQHVLGASAAPLGPGARSERDTSPLVCVCPGTWFKPFWGHDEVWNATFPRPAAG